MITDHVIRLDFDVDIVICQGLPQIAAAMRRSFVVESVDGEKSILSRWATAMETAGIRREAESASSGEREGPQPDGSNAVVVGFGRFGQGVTQMLLASNGFLYVE